ncbi:zinc ribbon domain-containing protein [Bacillus sp. T33-2]|uniref:zinc ribbon domain-containing protein n=1 Tax=Bacillus sp. T33-2 TaxID=2054168 RepID=UPI000C78F56B|nr:zinc ribbon domain-containing protein [Bacillus sp. T33-2]PLR99663.1 hypothetical protein CVD19_00970 [Bacillus sp. T33-2]
MAVFTGKMICSHCEKLYKRKNERGIFKWVCQGYDNYSSCKRIIVDENRMVEFISRRLKIEERSEENIYNLIMHKVDRIQVSDKNDFIVHMVNQEPMYMKEGQIQY